MFKPFKLDRRYFVAAFLLCTSALYAQAPTAAPGAPGRFTMNNAANVDVSVQFDQAMDAGTFTSSTFLVYGERTGFHAGVYAYTAGNQTATFSTTNPFAAGERVTAILTQDVTNSSGTPLAASLQWSFFIKASTGTAKMSPDSTYASGGKPHFVGVGDVDGDADMDIAIANSKDATVHVWSNDGAASYSLTETLNVGATPLSLTLADFDADGDLDAVVGNQDAGTISVFRNSGTGTYTFLGTNTTGTEPVWEASGDLDGDGFLDLVVVNLVSENISIFLNNGDGTFQGKVDYAVGNDPESAVLADFDTDGDLDVVVTSPTDNAITLFSNNGSAVLSSTQTIATGQSPRVIVTQDYNSDGQIDVATCNRDGDNISVLLNSGGTFAAATNFSVGATPFSITSGDFDGDLDADLAVSNRDSDNIYVLTNDGTATFQTDSIYATGAHPRALNSGDFNGDGVLDIAVANRNSDTFQVFLNTATGPTNALPEAPTLNSPAANAFLNQNTAQVVLDWNVPTDADADVLHFLVEVSTVSDFGTTVISVDSRTSTVGFSPAPPVAQGIGTVSYTVSTNLPDGEYYWRISAHDGTGFGATATARTFKIDATLPVIDATTLTNPAPGSAPNWYNQNTVASVDFQVQYDESNADRAVFDLGVLGGSQTVSSISSGTDQTATVQLATNGAADGSYPLSVTVFDSAGNLATNNSTAIALDGTPPSGTVASSPASSQTLSFTVSWAGATDSGSGLSGEYDVQVQVDGGAWTPWKTNFSGTSDSFTGENGKTYGFEAVAHDKVGNVATFLNSAETATNVDTTNDETAPSAPLNLTAGGENPSPWQRFSSFAIAWQEPADQSGIARAWYKRGAAPASNLDTTASVVGATSLNIDATAENGQNLYIWLEDNSGNVDFNNRAEVSLRYDATAPTGTEASSPSTSASLSFTVIWGGGTDAGSGLSGLYDVRVQVNGGDWSDWLTNFNGTSSPYTEGEQGKTYGFEAVAYDVAGNVEAFAQVSETSTEVDTTANDVTAPGPPTLLQAAGASPSPWQKDANFLINWLAPNDPSGIGIAYFKLGDAPTAHFDTTGSVAVGSLYPAVATAEDGQNFYLWFDDQKGNIDFNNYGFVTLRFDETPPEIFEMEFLNAHFSTNWLNPNLANVASTSLEYTEKHAQRVELASTALDTTIVIANPASGDDVPVPFDLRIRGRGDGPYQINFTVIDSAGNVERDSVELVLDGSPPTGATATSPDTSLARTFTVNWAGTGSDGVSGSGLSGLFDVRVQENSGTWSDWLTNFNGTSSEYLGTQGAKYSFEVLAHDNVGNIEVIRNVAESTTLVDTSFADLVPPTIQLTPLLVVDDGEDATIVATVADNAQVVSVLLFYRQSGVTTFQSVAMSQTSGNTYSAVIPASQLGTDGINYYIEVSDGTNIAHYPDSNWETLPSNLSVRIRGTDSQGLARTDALPSGTAATSYRLISVPLSLENSDPLAVLEDDLGKYDSKKWRLFQYQQSSDSYKEYPSVDDFEPGVALWLISKDADKRIDSGVGSSVATNAAFEFTLKKGWNDIGYPFTFSVNKSNVEVISGNVDDVVGPYQFAGQWAFPSQVTMLAPWEGYAFLSAVEGLKIAIHPNGSTSQSAANLALRKLQEPQSDWSIGIQAYCGELLDEHNRIGVSEGAGVEWDRLDYPEPPFISDYVSVRFHHPEWNKFGGVFKTDFRPQFSDGQVWSFEVATTLKNETVQLKFPDLRTLPAGFKAILLDREIYQRFDLDNVSKYEFVPEQTKLSRKFDLVIGTQAFIEQTDALNNFVPETFSLSQNFPNPFNGGTSLLYKVSEQSRVSIKVMNILGQEVRNLLDADMQPGVFRIKWDGRGNQGLEVGSGVYFIRMEAGKFHQIRKVLYIR